MTIEARRLILALPLVALAWIALLALVMRLSAAAPAALVLLPPADFIAALPADIALLSAGPASLTLTGGPDLVARLYAAGAPLVLPAGLGGCLGEAALPLGL